MRWLALLLLVCACTPEPIDSINVGVNKHPYIVGEYDCVQFVDDKYHALLNAGIPDEDMTVLYGWTPDNKQHVELRVIYKGGIYILDNRFNAANASPNIAVTLRIRPSSAGWSQLVKKHDMPVEEDVD